MILVDTSVIIGYLRGLSTPKIELFDIVLTRDIPFGISAYTFQEVLQGAQTEGEFKQLHTYLSTQTIYHLPADITAFEYAARLYYNLRRQGITPRSSIDLLIATVAVVNHLLLLHDDRDFDAIAAHTPDLQILRSLS
jgi:predicted nucleic acid-binding protein